MFMAFSINRWKDEIRQLFSNVAARSEVERECSLDQAKVWSLFIVFGIGRNEVRLGLSLNKDLTSARISLTIRIDG
jgi:hypothetical protein